MKIALTALLILVGTVVAGLEAWHRPAAEPAPGELRIAHAASRLSIDPRIVRDRAALGQRVVDALWDPLLEVGEKGEIRPAAAESWEVAADSCRVLLHLRSDLRWSNGDAVTAEDFVRTLRWMEQTRYPHPLTFQFQPSGPGRPEWSAANGVTALDDRTLAITLSERVPGIVFAIAGAMWIPLHRSTPEQLATGSYRRAPAELVTNGAFRLDEIGADTWRLVRNPRYRAASRVRVERVLLSRADGPSFFPFLVASGGADLSDAMLMQGADAFPTFTERTNAVSVLHFNVEKAPLNDPRVRRALSLALDREALARSLAGENGVAAFSCLSARPGETPERTVGEDLAEAKRLLAEAGFPEGRGLPVLRLPLLRSRQPSPIAYFCADQWRARLGITVYVIPLSADEINARLVRGEFDIMHFYWTLSLGETSLFAAAPLPALPRAYRLHLTAGQREQIDRARELQGAERRLAMQAVERELLSGMPCTPVAGYRRAFVIGPRTGGWRTDVSGAHPFSALEVRTVAPAP